MAKRKSKKTKDAKPTTSDQALANAIIKKIHNPALPKSMALKATQVFDERHIKGAKTMDGFENFAARLGLNNDNALSDGMYEFNLMTRNRVQLEAAYRGSWVVGAMIDSKAADMTRAGITITTNEDDKNIKEIQAAMARLKIMNSLSEGVKWGDLYGGALGVIQIEGQNLASPLDLDSVQKKQFQGVVIFDRWQLQPDLFNYIDSGPDMGLPKYYNIVTTASPSGMNTPEDNATGQIKVHFSRVIRFTGIDLPYWQAITESMWGESVLERIWDRLISFDTATMSTANLINRAQLRTVGVEGLRDILAAGGKAQQGLEAQFEMMRLLQVNEGLTLIDKNDTFASTAYSFAGLSDVLLQFGQQLAGGSGIPLVRLFGQSPAGLSATGESDLRNYYDNINAMQESKLRNGMWLILQVLWRSLFGKAAPEDLEFMFTPLWQMSLMDKATIGKTNAETVTGAYDAGLIDRSTAMKELRQHSGDTGLFSNISDEQVKEAESEPPPSPDMPPEPEKPAENPISEKNAVADSKPSAWKRIAAWVSRN